MSVRRSALLGLCVLFAAPISHPALAQTCGQWASGPGGPVGGIAGTGGQINSMVVWDPDGSGPNPPLLVVSGFFQVAGDQSTVVNVPGWSIATWNGAQWAAIGPPSANGTSLLGVFQNRLVAAGPGSPLHIYTFDGTAWASLGDGLGSGTASINAMSELNGQLVIAGSFTLAGQPAGVARWDGSA